MAYGALFRISLFMKLQRLWALIVLTSGIAQFFLVLLGAHYISETFQEGWVKIVAIIAPFWSLLWPYHAYATMKKNYQRLMRESLERQQAEALRKSK